MKAQLNELTSFIDAIPCALVVINKKKIIQSVNLQAQELFGYTEAELQQHSVNFLWTAEDGINFETRYEHYLKSPQIGFPEPFQLTGVNSNTNELPLQLHLGFWLVNQSVFTIISIKDLTKQSQLSSTNKQLEHSNFAKDQFVATMSHQLRTPLNAILGFSEILLMKLAGDLTSEQEKQLNIIHKSGKHLQALIDDLTDLAKIDSGETSPVMEHLAAQNLINEVVESLRPRADEKDLSLITQLPEQIIILDSDKVLLTQILRNLLDNAIKFTTEGEVLVKLFKENNKAIIQVNDTGLGIKEEKMDRLFLAFQQLFIAEKKNEGSGLGLHISKKLADLIQARLEIKSKFNVGTQCSIIIPMATPSKIA